MYQISELKARFDARASFYGKATIKKNSSNIILLSYNTEILKYNKTTKKLKFLTKEQEHFTTTTNRHINEFLKQFTTEGAKTKKQLLKMANIKGV